MLLYFNFFKQCISTLCSSIFFLVSFQHFFYVFLSKSGRINHAWKCIIWWKLIFNNLNWKNVWKICYNAKRESMAIIFVHVTYNFVYFWKLLQSHFQLNFIPLYHWRHFIIIFAFTHENIFIILKLVFLLKHSLRLYNLLKFFSPFIPQFFKLNKNLPFFLNIFTFFLLWLYRFISYILKILNRFRIYVKSMAQRSKFYSLNKFLCIPCNSFFICNYSKIYINIILSQTRKRRSITIICIAWSLLLLRSLGRLKMVLSF